MITVEVPGSESVFLRAADATDALTFLEWRNDPWIVSLGKSKSTVTKQKHLAWFSKTLIDPRRNTFVILVDHEPAGGVFFSISGNVATISLYLLKPFTGRNLGPSIIAQTCQNLFECRPTIESILAEVLTSNPPSLKAFQKTGFKKFSEDENTISLKLTRPDPPKAIPHNRPTWDEAESAAAADAAASGRWVNGPWTKALEDRLSKISTGSWAATSSGISAIKLSLHALKIGPGDEVIVPAYSCVALPNAVLALGATPIPADINDNLNISTDATLLALSKKSKAIIAVHTFGLAADISGLKESKLPVIEDGSHGFPVINGNWNIQGDLALLSFYATKLFGCGQGGAVMTRSKEQLEIIRDLSSYADKAPSPHRDNLGLSEMEAAIAYRQLDKQTRFLEHRQKIAAIYRSHFASISIPGNGISYRYTISLPDEITLLALQGHLSKNEITAERPVELWNDNVTAKNAYQTTMSLPLFPSLSEEDAHRVSDLISTFLSYV